jgi:hypothetical protein
MSVLRERDEVRGEFDEAARRLQQCLGGGASGFIGMVPELRWLERYRSVRIELLEAESRPKIWVGMFLQGCFPGDISAGTDDRRIGQSATRGPVGINGAGVF